MHNRIDTDFVYQRIMKKKKKCFLTQQKILHTLHNYLINIIILKKKKCVQFQIS